MVFLSSRRRKYWPCFLAKNIKNIFRLLNISFGLFRKAKITWLDRHSSSCCPCLQVRKLPNQRPLQKILLLGKPPKKMARLLPTWLKVLRDRRQTSKTIAVRVANYKKSKVIKIYVFNFPIKICTRLDIVKCQQPWGWYFRKLQPRRRPQLEQSSGQDWRKATGFR